MNWERITFENGKYYVKCPYCGKIWEEELAKSNFKYCPECGKRVKEETKLEKTVREILLGGR